MSQAAATVHELRDVAWTPLDESLRRLEMLASPLVGIARRVFVQLHDTDDARCHAVGAVATASEELIGAPCNELNGGGGMSQSGARAAAIGETVERYSAAYVDEPRLLLGSARELDVPTVPPERFEWFAEWQTASRGFPFAQFTADTPVRWVEGFSLADGAPAWIPAQLVFLDPATVDGEQRVIHATSNGLACGPSPEEAVLGGLLELVERDAFMLTWYGQLSLPRIDVSGDPALSREIARVFDAAGLRHDIVDLSGFCAVPAALAIVRNELTDSAVLAVGAGAGVTMRTAVRKALVEAYQTRTWARAEQRMRPDFGEGAQPLEQLITSFDDHVRLYAGPGPSAWAEFLSAATQTRPIDDVPELPSDRPLNGIRAIVHRLRERDVDVYAVDATSPDVRDAGLAVMKVLSPQLRALDVGYRFRQLGGQRVLAARRLAGLDASDLTAGELNPHPHPFP